MNFVLERLYENGTNGPPENDPPEKITLAECGQSYTCGRGKENHIVCPSVVVSRKHCIFFHSNDGLYVSDLQSSNGIYINGNRQRPLQMIKLCENDIIGIGCSNIVTPNDNMLYAYKICFTQLSTNEEAENSALPEAPLSNDAEETSVTAAEPAAAAAEPAAAAAPLQRRGCSRSTDCDTIPNKIPKYNDSNFDNSKLRCSKEIDESPDQDNKTSHSNSTDNNNSNTINSITTIVDVPMEVDDDIEIIHVASIATKMGTKSHENRTSKPTEPLNSHYICDVNCNTMSTKPSENCTEKVKMKIAANDNGDNNIDVGNAGSVNKPVNKYVTEKAWRDRPGEEDLDKTTDELYFAKAPNLVCTEDRVIKLEDELQITDDDEAEYLAPADSKMICAASPIKLKKVKHEAKTQFSEVDVVDLSDDEASVFPYSQLFDKTYENEAEKNKIAEIKQECVDNDDENNERIGLLNVDDEIDEVIILTDEEDEDNPWLERLSRSQLLCEDKKPEPMETIVKDEIDLGIWEEDEIFKLSYNFEFPDNTGTYLTDEKNDAKCEDINMHGKTSAKEIVDSVDVSDHSREISLGTANATNKRDTDTRLDMKLDKEMKEPDNLTAEPDNLTAKPDNLTAEPDNLTAEPDNLTAEPDSLTTEPDAPTGKPTSASVENTKTKCFVTRTKRLIPIIEAQSLPVGRRKRTEHSTEKQKKTQKQTDERSQLTHEKSKLTVENKTSKSYTLKDQISENFYGKRRKRHKSVTSSCLPNEAKTVMFITKEEKKIISEKRKAKLKEIAEEEKKLLAQNSKIVKRRTAKPRAKMSLKNRGDFLITERKAATSRPDKSTEAPSRSSANQSADPSTNKAKTLNEHVTSDAKTQKSYRKGDSSKSTVTNITTSLQQSLHLNDIADSVQVTRKNSIQEAKTIDKERKNSSSKVRNHEIASKDQRSQRAKTSELRDKSTKRVSILVQKENYSPNRKDAGKSRDDRARPIEESGKQKKRVSFSENVVVKYFEIETQNYLKKLVGKDAPIPTNKLAKTMTTTTTTPSPSCGQWQHPKLEKFLLCIFLWNPVWLEEQRYLKCDPPIVPDSVLQPMKLSYASYEEYYMIAKPLLLLEIWSTMIKDYENVEKNKHRVTAVCSIVENSITHTPIRSTNHFLTTLTIEVLVEKDDFDNQTHPIYGDLVSFEYAKNVGTRQIFHKVFAYVTNMHQVVITNFTYYNKDLTKYVNKPYAVITYTLLTRLLEPDIAVNRVQRIRTVTYLRASIRMVQALQYLPQSSLLNVILNPKIEDYQLPVMNEAALASLPRITEDNLNPKQLEATYRVSETVLRRESKLCFIQGPPGTGKSKVIVNLVSRMLYSDNNKPKILVCAPSNAATDEIVLRLLAVRSNFKPKRFNMVRIGRPETMHPTAKSISVTELAKRYIIQITGQPCYEEELTDLQTRINSLQNTLSSCNNIYETKRKDLEKKLADASMRYNIRKLLDGNTWDTTNAKIRAKIQRLSEDMILNGADVITCTLSSCYTNQMESIFGGCKNNISVCIVDEATQSCEAETLIPLMLGINTLILVGDPNQLPATILNQDAKRLGLDQSIFLRVQKIFASHASNPIIMLNTQYRMDYAISYWPNKYFYGGKLRNATHPRIRFPFHSYRVLDHNSAQNNDKFSNTTEAEFVANIIFVILAFGKWDSLGENACVSVGILTPYNNQRTLVLNKINEKISPLPESLKKKISFEVNTVDSFQGQERDVIIMSCVRSQGIGFLSDRQRLCVALTRAKQSLIICGNFNTFMRDKMWNALLTDARCRKNLFNVDARATPTKIKQFIVK